MGYALAGMCFNSVSMHHMLDMFHVCYEVTSVHTAEPKSVICDSNQWNTEKSVDCELVVERGVAEAVEWSGIEKKEKNKEKIVISSQDQEEILLMWSSNSNWFLIGEFLMGLAACLSAVGYYSPVEGRIVGATYNLRACWSYLQHHCFPCMPNLSQQAEVCIN